MNKLQLVAVAVQAIASATCDDHVAYLNKRIVLVEERIAICVQTLAAANRIPQVPVLRYQLDKAIEAVVALRLALPMMTGLSAAATSGGWVDPEVKAVFGRFDPVALEQLEGHLRDARQRNEVAVSRHEEAALRREAAERELATRQHELAALHLALDLLKVVAPMLNEK